MHGIEKILPDNVEERRQFVDAFEKELLKHPQDILPVKNYFTEKIYVRWVELFKGQTITSEIHKTEHPFFLMKGKMIVGDVESGDVAVLEAPYVGVTAPGTKRVVTAIEDVIFVTAHATELKDVEAIGNEILVQRDDNISQYKHPDAQNIYELKAINKQIQ